MEEKEEKLKSNTEKKAREINSAADQLNKILIPANCTFYSHGMVWSIRNVAFWEHLKKKDEEFLKLINIQVK